MYANLAASLEDERQPTPLVSKQTQHPLIQEVWADNLEAEIQKICEVVSHYQYIAIDTEFPGIVARPTGYGNASEYSYYTVKCNVDLLKVIQLGVTFSDSKGNLPPGTSTWQFNFFFDLSVDMFAQDSIDFLRMSGINFGKHCSRGIDMHQFGELIMGSGLVMNDRVKWVSFHGCYDFGYLLKLLTCKPLPHHETQFFDLLGSFFPSLYDIKVLLGSARCPQFNCGSSLQKVAEHLEVQRIGHQHQAGSDSLLTSKAFFALMHRYFDNQLDDFLYSGVIYGLSPPPRPGAANRAGSSTALHLCGGSGSGSRGWNGTSASSSSSSSSRRPASSNTHNSLLRMLTPPSPPLNSGSARRRQTPQQLTSSPAPRRLQPNFPERSEKGSVDKVTNAHVMHTAEETAGGVKQSCQTSTVEEEIHGDQYSSATTRTSGSDNTSASRRRIHDGGQPNAASSGAAAAAAPHRSASLIADPSLLSSNNQRSSISGGGMEIRRISSRDTNDAALLPVKTLLAEEETEPNGDLEPRQRQKLPSAEAGNESNAEIQECRWSSGNGNSYSPNRQIGVEARGGQRADDRNEERNGRSETACGDEAAHDGKDAAEISRGVKIIPVADDATGISRSGEADEQKSESVDRKSDRVELRQNGLSRGENELVVSNSPPLDGSDANGAFNAELSRKCGDELALGSLCESNEGQGESRESEWTTSALPLWATDHVGSRSSCASSVGRARHEELTATHGVAVERPPAGALPFVGTHSAINACVGFARSGVSEGRHCPLKESEDATRPRFIDVPAPSTSVVGFRGFVVRQ